MSEYREIPGPIEGYKIFNEDMTCRDFQFKEGVINELGNDAPLSLCNNGFHFCKYPSGVLAYYNAGRVWKIRAYDVLEMPEEPGADYKLVCRRIELVSEVNLDGNWNTGYRNTGDQNTGDRNTGNWNTGDGNTGDRNTGDRNTGYRNTGDRNTGNWNTGDRNTGNWNTGDRNTGNGNTGNGNTGYRNTGSRNTGDRNTGSRNTGDGNTGDGNTGDRNTGYFHLGDAPLTFFGKPVKDENAIDWGLASRLGDALMSDEPFDPTPYLSLPNATKAYIKRIHKDHIERRKKAKESK